MSHNTIALRESHDEFLVAAGWITLLSPVARNSVTSATIPFAVDGAIGELLRNLHAM